jgi:hypothetical protein
VLRRSDARRNRIRASVAILNWFRDVWVKSEVMPRLAALEAQLSEPAEARNYIDDEPRVLRPVPFGMVADDPE